MKKLALMALAMVLALGTLGVGYALWSETLYIEGTVYTGEVDAEWTACGCWDVGNDPNNTFPVTYKDKDVGSTECYPDPDDPQILHIVVYNAYPCYFNDCQVEFTNTGTVPVIIESIIITPLDFTLASGYGVNDGEVWVEWINGVGIQLHPGQSAGSSLKFHVEQCAAELATYNFSIEVLLVQYNESAHYTP